MSCNEVCTIVLFCSCENWQVLWLRNGLFRSTTPKTRNRHILPSLEILTLVMVSASQKRRVAVQNDAGFVQIASVGTPQCFPFTEVYGMPKWPTTSRMLTSPCVDELSTIFISSWTVWAVLAHVFGLPLRGPSSHGFEINYPGLRTSKLFSSQLNLSQEFYPFVYSFYGNRIVKIQ